jgi:hypothetical protein
LAIEWLGHALQTRSRRQGSAQRSSSLSSSVESKPSTVITMLPVAQYQLAQRSLDSLELRVLPSAPLSPVHERELRRPNAACCCVRTATHRWMSC